MRFQTPLGPRESQSQVRKEGCPETPLAGEGAVSRKYDNAVKPFSPELLKHIEEQKVLGLRGK